MAEIIKIANRFLKWVTSNSNIFVIAFGLLLIFMFKMNSCNRLRVEKANSKAERWEEKYNESLSVIAQNDKDIKQYQESYDSISLIADSISKVLVEKEKEFIDKEKDYISTIEDLKDVPTDTIYLYTQNIWPNLDNQPMEYPYTSSQVRSIYRTYVSMNYYKNASEGLQYSLNNSHALVGLKEQMLIERNKEIHSLMASKSIQERLLYDANNTIDFQDKTINRIKHAKNIYRAAAVIEFAYIIIREATIK